MASNNHQRVHRKPAPVVYVPSMSPTATDLPPSRSAPQIPYEAINRKDRPAPGEYGRAPGSSENTWVPPENVNRSIPTADPLSGTTSRLRKPLPPTSVGDVDQIPMSKPQEDAQLPAFNVAQLPTPAPNPWDEDQTPKPQRHQSGWPVAAPPIVNSAKPAPQAHANDLTQVAHPGSVQYSQHAQYGEVLQTANDQPRGGRSGYYRSSHAQAPQLDFRDGPAMQVPQAAVLSHRSQLATQRITSSPPVLPGSSQKPLVGGQLAPPAPIPKVPTPRSVSQPPETRRENMQTPSSNRLQKSPQPDPIKHNPTRSADASPTLQPHDKPDLQASVMPSTHPNALHASNEPNPYHSDGGNSGGRHNRRRSWMPGVRSRQTSRDTTRAGTNAWIFDGTTETPYDLQALINAQKVPELWDDAADTFVYLFPRASGRGPSFKVPSLVISSSAELRTLAFGETSTSSRHRARSFDGRSSLSAHDAARLSNMRHPSTPPYTPTSSGHVSRTSSGGSATSISSLGDPMLEGHIYFPWLAYDSSKKPPKLPSADVDHLVSVRNLFAFLMRRPLVLTKHSPNAFSSLCLVANHLKRLGFSNFDGSTYGEVVSASLDFYINSLDLADVRSSREKTLEAIVLGERLQSMELYNEAFAHAIGKWEDTKNMKSPIWDLVTPDTRNRLQRASWDLSQRQSSMQLRLYDCEFPSLFTGLAASTSTVASKSIRFKNWKSAFGVMRKHVLSYYKDLHGDWPPRAKSKKNTFTVSGFNRLVLKGLYTDFCQLYDLLVDRESLTTRSMNMDEKSDDEEAGISTTALRKVLAEYDHSYPPVQPPIPFDVPKVPTLATIDPRHNEHAHEIRRQDESRKLQEHEMILLLTKSHNLDSDVRSPFLQAFHALEQKEGRGKCTLELAEQRYGYWLFLYVIIQALPMLTIDAPGLRYREGVEYFLCQPPRGGLPWMDDASSTRRAWYGIAGSSGVVALPSDIVEHSVEAIYRRSHCWIAAQKWLDAAHNAAGALSDLHGDPPILEGRRQSLPYDSPEVDNGSENSHPRLGRQLSSITEMANNSPTTSNSHSFAHQHGHPRARSASNHRQSIAFNLEPLPVPPGFLISPQTSSSLTPGSSPTLTNRQQNNNYGIGGDVELLGRRQTMVDAGGAQGKSFDEILVSVDQDKQKDKLKRKSFYGLG